MTIPPPSLIADNVLKALAECAASTPDGCFVEVGVYKGGSAFVLAKVAEQQKRQFFAYDTFTGIPCPDPYGGHLVGDFADVDFESIKQAIPYATFVKGLFPDSIHPDTKQVSFAHLDVDQYDSYKNSINALLPLMAKGGVFWFDDPGAHAGLVGAVRAVKEAFGDRIQIHPCGKWFVVC